MTLMRKFLNSLNMNNWNGKSSLSRWLRVITKLLFYAPTLIIFLLIIFVFAYLNEIDKNHFAFAKCCSICLLLYILVFIPLNIFIRTKQAHRSHMSLLKYLYSNDYVSTTKENDPDGFSKGDENITPLTPQEMQSLITKYETVERHTIHSNSSTSSCQFLTTNNVQKTTPITTFNKSFPININHSPSLAEVNLPQKLQTPFIEQSHTLSKQQKSNTRKKLHVSDAFLWQCNSIAKLQDSDNLGYEYTNLDNPEDPLEVGYRNALLNISDYNSLPLIDYSKDSQVPEGYIPREFISWKHDFEQCKNIFMGGNLPIVSNLEYITRNINTSIFRESDGSFVRSVQETFYYEVPYEYQSRYLQLIDILNNLLIVEKRFLINLSEIVFTRTADIYIKYALPLSCIYYEPMKNIFRYTFSNEKAINGEYSTKYKNTESGSIIYSENGELLKATFIKIIDNVTYTCKFKKYKSGFDLYNIKGNGEIIYKRNKE